jgi:hypothetical protein
MNEKELAAKGIAIKIKKNAWGEYEVKVLDRGRVLHALTYHTDCIEDARQTKADMIKHFTL